MLVKNVRGCDVDTLSILTRRTTGQVVILSSRGLDANSDSASWEYDFEMLASTSLNAFFPCKTERASVCLSQQVVRRIT